VLDGIVRQGEDDRGELVKTRVASQLHEQARQHLKRAAGLAFDAFQRSPFDHLLVATPTPEVRSELEPLLHPYLRDRLAEQLAVPVNAPEDQIRAAVVDAEARVEQRTEATLVGRLRDAVGARDRAVDGLKATLAALGKHRVDRLLVSRGFSAEGWRCDECGCLATIGRSCPECGARMVHAPDIVEDAVEQALAQGCRVDVLVANADLDVLGGIGAFLRY
jgi:peptide subunit release factor 1 (eRF1)